MGDPVVLDAEALRAEVRDKYRAVAAAPDATYHFHTGPGLAARLGYEPDVGFVDIAIGPPTDTFGGAGGEANARAYEVYGYAFVARKPA